MASFSPGSRDSFSFRLSLHSFELSYTSPNFSELCRMAQFLLFLQPFIKSDLSFLDAWLLQSKVAEFFGPLSLNTSWQIRKSINLEGLFFFPLNFPFVVTVFCSFVNFSLQLFSSFLSSGSAQTPFKIQVYQLQVLFELFESFELCCWLLVFSYCLFRVSPASTITESVALSTSFGIYVYHYSSFSFFSSFFFVIFLLFSSTFSFQY